MSSWKIKGDPMCGAIVEGKMKALFCWFSVEWIELDYLLFLQCLIGTYLNSEEIVHRNVTNDTPLFFARLKNSSFAWYFVELCARCSKNNTLILAIRLLSSRSIIPAQLHKTPEPNGYLISQNSTSSGCNRSGSLQLSDDTCSWKVHRLLLNQYSMCVASCSIYRISRPLMLYVAKKRNEKKKWLNKKCDAFVRVFNVLNYVVPEESITVGE